MATPHASTPWKEHVLEPIPVADGDVGDAVTCLLHTILFTRAPGPVRPSEATCHAFPSISYSLCAVGDVSRKVEHAVKRLEEMLTANMSAALDLDALGGYSGGYGGSHRGSFGTSQRLPPPPPQSAATSTSAYVAVSFFDRTVKKALFGLMSNEEKVYFEKWIIPVHVQVVPPSPTQQENATQDTEIALQNAILHILAAVQQIDHVSVKMYDFEITPYSSLEALQSDGGSGAYGLGFQAGNTSVRLMV